MKDPLPDLPGLESGRSGFYYRGLKNYLYYFGVSLLLVEYNWPPNPILIIEDPTLEVQGFWYRD